MLLLILTVLLFAYFTDPVFLMDGSDEAKSILEAKLSKAEANIAYWSGQCQEYQYMWAECASHQDEIMVQEGFH